MAVSETFRRLRTSAWLGWQVESNWADPVVFFIYLIARPLAVALTLAAMYAATRSTATQGGAFAGFYVANAFHAYVNTMVVGMGWVIFEEREESEMLKYVYVSPMGLVTYIAGRSFVRFVLGSISAVLMLLVGWFLLGVRWDFSLTQPLPLAITLVAGLGATLAAGYLICGVAMVLTRSAVTVLEGCMLGLYLLCGVIFPVDLMPVWIRPLSYVLPFTWWYECLRRFLLGHGSSAGMNTLSDTQLLGAMLAVCVGFSLAAAFGYRALDQLARRLGRLDQTTMF